PPGWIRKTSTAPVFRRHNSTPALSAGMSERAIERVAAAGAHRVAFLLVAQAELLEVLHEVGQRRVLARPVAEEGLAQRMGAGPEPLRDGHAAGELLEFKIALDHAFAEHLPVMADRAVGAAVERLVVVERAGGVAVVDATHGARGGAVHVLAREGGRA